MRASVAYLPDHYLVEVADRLHREYVGAMSPDRVLDVVLHAGRSLRDSALSRAVLTDLLEQAARRALVHEIASASLDREPEHPTKPPVHPGDEPGLESAA